MNELSRGSPASIHLNFALALLPVSLTLLVTLQTATITEARAYSAYWIAFWATLVQGLSFLALWWRNHRTTERLVEEIKNRMPPPGIPEPPVSERGGS